MMDIGETIFSLDEELSSPADSASTGRARLQAGALARGSLREVCFLRKITPTGAILCVDSAVTPGDRLDLALLTGEELAGTAEWVSGSEVGLRFDAPADMFAIITRNLVQQPGDARRLPRMELRCRAWLEAGARRELVTVGDLSEGGAGIEARAPLEQHQQVTLTMEDFRPIRGTVRWTKGTAAGIAFEPALTWQELMPWLKRHHDTTIALPEPDHRAAPSTDASEIPTRGATSVGLNLAARVREGSRRWAIEVLDIDTHQVRFLSYAALEPGRLFWISLPGLTGWPARITDVTGDQITCAFTQPLHPAVLEKVLTSASQSGLP